MMRAGAKVIRATVSDPSPMLEHFDVHLRRVIQKAKAHAERVVLVRQSWFGKITYTPEEAAHMCHGGTGQAWREEITTYYSVDVTCKLMALLDERADRLARNFRSAIVDREHRPLILDPDTWQVRDLIGQMPLRAIDRLPDLHV